MSRDFDNKKAEDTLSELFYQTKWKAEAYTGGEPLSVRNYHFFERLHYGVIDSLNNSIVPKKNELTTIGSVRVLNIVADHYALMKMNLKAAQGKGVFSQAGEIFGNLKGVEAYEDPEIRYGEYLSSILRFYNETHIPNIIGTNSIASYDDYVNHFFKLILETQDQTAITMTRWNTTINSNILHTGLAFSYADIGFNDNQAKIDFIVDNPHFQYFSNLCVNMGFCMANRNPHILVYDVSSPAGESIRTNYNINTLEDFFNRFYIRTYTLDNDLLYRYINIYYNKYVRKNFNIIPIVKVEACKTVTEYAKLDLVPTNQKLMSDNKELETYIHIRNTEEGEPYNSHKIKNIYKKSYNLYKRLDKPSAFSYINNMFRDQVWNKDYGYHDLVQQQKGQTQTEAQRQQTGGGPTSGGSSY